MQLPDLSNFWWFLAATLTVFAIVLGRYLLIAGAFYLVFYIWNPKKWKKRMVNNRNVNKKQFRKEFGWSMITSLVFAITGALTALLWQQGVVKVYTDINAFPIWWLPVSFLIAILLHETYYYWLHRWMHHPRVFRIVHKVHHESNTTSPWTAFSFHPIEGILQAVFLPVLLMIMPMHLYVLIIHLSFMTLSSVVNHLNIEIYPKNFHRHLLGRWFIGATHHALHHSQFKYNYGLYFTFWDKWKKTESPQYSEVFERVSAGNKPLASESTECI